ncbi:MAG: winged helix-turn-helix domain-containing protein [Clostridia bacterium]|nr:winged helix-turn-helix domain-containing protein [Clostridia bacterium]
MPDLVWRWRTEEGLTTREIAARLGVSVGTLLRRIPQVERRRYWEWKWGLPFEEGMERLLRERSQAEVARMTGFSESFVSAFVRRSRRAAVGRLA